MDILIFSVLGISLVLFLVYVSKEQRKWNDIKKAAKDHYDFEEADNYK